MGDMVSVPGDGSFSDEGPVDERISADEARRLREAATPGPWDVAEHGEEEFWFGAGYFAIEVGDPDEYGGHGVVAITGNHGNAAADMALIAAAPRLAATVERLEADNQRLCGLLDKVLYVTTDFAISDGEAVRQIELLLVALTDPKAAVLSDEGDTSE